MEQVLIAIENIAISTRRVGPRGPTHRASRACKKAETDAVQSQAPVSLTQSLTHTLSVAQNQLRNHTRGNRH